MGFSIDRSRGKVSDIKQNIETKKGELSQLEEQKQALLDAGTDIQGSDIDEDVQQTLMAEINSALEANSEKAQEVSDEMNDDVSDLEGMKQETQDSMSSNQSERGKLEQKKSLLDRFGIGSSLDGALGELDDNRTNLEELQEDLTETAQEIDQLAARFSTI